MKISGKLKGNTFTISLNGELKTYRVVENKTTRTRVVSENYSEQYTHITRVAYDDNDNRVGNIESGSTGLSFILNTNNK